MFFLPIRREMVAEMMTSEMPVVGNSGCDHDWMVFGMDKPCN